MKATYGQQPETVLADSDYSNERDLAELEARGIDEYVALGREGRSGDGCGDMADGAEAGDGDGSGHLRQAQMDLGNAAQLDHRGIRIPSVRRPGTTKYKGSGTWCP